MNGSLTTTILLECIDELGAIISCLLVFVDVLSFSFVPPFLCGVVFCKVSVSINMTLTVYFARHTIVCWSSYHMFYSHCVTVNTNCTLNAIVVITGSLTTECSFTLCTTFVVCLHFINIASPRVYFYGSLE